MSNLPVDRDKEYMHQMWGTTHLITDYKTEPPKRIIQEIMHDLAPNHNLKNKLIFMKKFVMMKIMMIGNMAQNLHMENYVKKYYRYIKK